MTKCSVDGCRVKIHAKGLCTKHYQRFLKHGDPKVVKIRHTSRNERCSIDGCTASVKASSLCSAHYWRLKNGKPMEPAQHLTAERECAVGDCTNRAISKGYCGKHYRRYRLHGDAETIPTRRARPKRKGPGGRHVNAQGYVSVYWPDNPNAKPDGTVLEHRAVLSEQLGRPLLEFENVHHKNGIRHDNSPENLELWTRAQPPGRRVADAIEYANKIISLYGSDPSKFN